MLLINNFPKYYKAIKLKNMIQNLYKDIDINNKNIDTTSIRNKDNDKNIDTTSVRNNDIDNEDKYKNIKMISYSQKIILNDKLKDIIINILKLKYNNIIDYLIDNLIFKIYVNDKLIYASEYYYQLSYRHDIIEIYKNSNSDELLCLIYDNLINREKLKNVIANIKDYNNINKLI
jgi:hypothetical protein